MLDASSIDKYKDLDDSRTERLMTLRGSPPIYESTVATYKYVHVHTKLSLTHPASPQFFDYSASKTTFSTLLHI